MKHSAYLDYAAATPLDLAVLNAMQPHLTQEFANPSSLHRVGREQAKALESARVRVAKVLGAKPTEIIFTSGSTESAVLAITGVARAVPMSRLVVGSIEHEAVLNTVARLEDEGHQEGIIAVTADGLVSPEQVAAAVDDMTVLVCVQYANNEIGTIQPIGKIGAAIAEIRADRLVRGVTRPLYFYCDAAQAGSLNLQVARLGVDLMSLGGSKLYGPSGSGILYVRTGTELHTLGGGGGQESGLRGGTENVAAAVGFATALERVQASRTADIKRESALRDWLWKEIQHQLPEAIRNGAASPRLAGNLNFTIPGADGETLVAYLDKEGYAVATGSACTASNDKPSHVLLAIGCSTEAATSSLRITIGRPTTKTELQGFVKALVKIVPRVQELSVSRSRGTI